MSSTRFRLLIYATLVATKIFGFCSYGSEPKPDNGSGWLFPELLSMYDTVLQDDNLKVKDLYVRGLHRVAFEYWRISRTNQIAAPLQYRRVFRDLLHRRAASDIFWNDPCAILPFFVNGKLTTSFEAAPTGGLFGVYPVQGLDVQSLTLPAYKEMVSEFQRAFADFRKVFPAEAPYIGEIVRSNANIPEVDVKRLSNALQNMKWPAVSFVDRLPLAFQDKPEKAFEVLMPEAQAYFMPAFLRMCEVERNQEKVKLLPEEIATVLGAHSGSADALRAKLNQEQRKLILGNFEAWYKDVPINKLKQEFGF